jgi:hypothetical protein
MTKPIPVMVEIAPFQSVTSLYVEKYGAPRPLQPLNADQRAYIEVQKAAWRS